MRKFFPLLVLSIVSSFTNYGQDQPGAHLAGKLSIDTSWDSNIYLSYIPTFEDMYAMSNEMIIARTGIDSLGHFEFDIDFLPQEERLYRLHLIKKGDTPATLIIGGKDENHLFLILNRFSNVKLKSDLAFPPFKDVDFKNSGENKAIQHITETVYTADSIAAESSASKRLLINNRLENDLLTIADTSDNFLISLYAIYKSNFETNYSSNEEFYNSYSKKWRNLDNAYYEAFSEQLPIEKTGGSTIFIWVAFVFLFAITGIFIGKLYFKRNNKIDNLSVQERKVYELLQKGATNQEISSHFNISLSTVKSHVSSIYSKLKVKSRKEILKTK